MYKRSVLELLESALKSSRLELSEFGSIFPEEGCLPYPKTEKDVTPFIRERTALYRKTWLIDPLLEAIEILGGKHE